ncbi:hypothetical protein MRB53_034771 [Persea americana]|uniref:Uncharacterized protein n=1 Tax=Persea americana TaxID=3435 RepID=A0ACC2K2R1_PERAE|nr:hypothetical protein MRB53_034771 [Persea americana]
MAAVVAGPKGDRWRGRLRWIMAAAQVQQVAGRCGGELNQPLGCFGAAACSGYCSWLADKLPAAVAGCWLAIPLGP